MFTNYSLSTKIIVKLAFRISVTIVLLTLILLKINLHQFWQTLKMARWEYLSAVCGLIVMLFWINSIKMRFILKRQDCKVNLQTLFGASAITSFYSMIMPGLLGTGAKWYILKKDTGKGSQVFSSMVYNQLSMIVVMILLGLVALMVANPMSTLLPDIRNKWLPPSICGMLIATIIFICLLLLNSRAEGKVVRWFHCVLRRLPTKIQQKSKEVLGQLAVFQTVGCRFHLIIVLITIVNSFAGSVVVYILAAKGASIAVPLGVFFWLPVIIYILGRIPISIANLGVREVTLVGILAAYGVDASAALLMSMILFSGAVFMAIIGAVFQFCWAIDKKSDSAIE